MEFLDLRCPGDDPPCNLSGLVALTAALIDVLDPSEAMVDGFSDCDRLPSQAEAALADLRAVAYAEHERQVRLSRWDRWIGRKGPTYMGVTFDLRVGGRHVLEEFGPYSINA